MITFEEYQKIKDQGNRRGNSIFETNIRRLVEEKKTQFPKLRGSSEQLKYASVSRNMALYKLLKYIFCSQFEDIMVDETNLGIINRFLNIVFGHTDSGFWFEHTNTDWESALRQKFNRV